MQENNKSLSLLQKIKQKAKEQKNYGGEFKGNDPNMSAKTCPNCGAGRASEDGLTHCAYCNFEFLSAPLTDGINIKKQDNSHK